MADLDIYTAAEDPYLGEWNLEGLIKPGFENGNRMESEDDGSDTKREEDEKQKDKGSFNLDTRPTVSFCSWKKFKNRHFRSIGEPCDFVVDTIEVLVNCDDLEEKIEAEQLRRMSKEKRKEYMANPRLKVNTNTNTSELRYERIRINSSIVLAHLAKISGNTSWSMRWPMTFLHPFAFLTHHQKSIKALLEDLEAELSHGTDAVDLPNNINDETFGNIEDSEPAVQRKALAASMRTKKASEQVRCYVEFVDKELIPYYRRFEQASHKKPMKIRFDDLWSLFRHGELVCYKYKKSARHYDRNRADELGRAADSEISPPPREATKVQTDVALDDKPLTADTCCILRLTSILIPDRDWVVKYPGVGATDIFGHISKGPEKSFGLQGYYLDFDGQKYAPAQVSVHISHFTEEKDIHKLPIFPIRFLKNKDTLLKELREGGKVFRRLISNAASGSKLMAYNGWGLTSNKGGYLRPGSQSTDPGLLEYIER